MNWDSQTTLQPMCGHWATSSNSSEVVTWDAISDCGRNEASPEIAPRHPQLDITEGVNVYLRSLLVGCGNHVMGPRRKDSTLRRRALHLASRRGNQSRKVGESGLRIAAMVVWTDELRNAIGAGGSATGAGGRPSVRRTFRCN